MSPHELFTLAGDAISRGGSLTFTVSGDSMRPLLRSGRDSVRLTAPVRPYRVGDLVLAQAGGRVLLHTVIAVDYMGTTVTLMGAGNLQQKEVCHVSAIAGVVSEVTRNGQTISTSSRKWKMCDSTWRQLLPFRRLLLFIDRKLHNAF